MYTPRAPLRKDALKTPLILRTHYWINSAMCFDVCCFYLEYEMYTPRAPLRKGALRPHNYYYHSVQVTELTMPNTHYWSGSAKYTQLDQQTGELINTPNT